MIAIDELKYTLNRISVLQQNTDSVEEEIISNVIVQNLGPMIKQLEMMSGSHYLIAKVDNFNLFQAFPESPAIPVAADPYVALSQNNNENLFLYNVQI